MGVDALSFYRLGRRARAIGLPLVPALIRKLSFYLHSSFIPEDADIGEGTQIGYGGIGVVIHKESRIGRFCLISQQVTVGGRSGKQGAPVIESFVRIGAGAKVLGPVKVGMGAVIGANAVVIKDVPEGAVVAGVPAVELRVDPNWIENLLNETNEREHVTKGYREALEAEQRRRTAREEAADLVH